MIQSVCPICLHNCLESVELEKLLFSSVSEINRITSFLIIFLSSDQFIARTEDKEVC